MHASRLTFWPGVEAIRVSARTAAVHELLALSLHRIEVPFHERAVTIARILVVVADVLQSGQGGRDVRTLFVLLADRYGEARLRQTAVNFVAVCWIVGRVAQTLTAFLVHKSIVV